MKCFEYVSSNGNRAHNKQITCGDQQNMNTNEPATSKFAKRLLDRSVDVCDNGNSDGATFFALCA